MCSAEMFLFIRDIHRVLLSLCLQIERLRDFVYIHRCLLHREQQKQMMLQVETSKDAATAAKAKTEVTW